jgi:hypothetical protein
VKNAKRNGKILRVAGVQHSAPQIIFEDDSINIKLQDSLRDIKILNKFTDGNKRFAREKVGADCNLGIDPMDRKSNARNSFTRFLNSAGYALPFTGGMSHHTIAGYLSTSSSGGSLQFGAADCLEGIKFVDGTGKLRTINKH